MVCYHQSGQSWTDLVASYQKKKKKKKASHHCYYFSVERFGKDLLQVFQWITSADKLLLSSFSCAVFPTVTRTAAALIIILSKTTT